MKKVWIIDDDQDMVGAIRLMVKLLDCEERHFFSARPAAQALLDGERPDLCILDINMPEVSGLDFLEFLRRRNDLKDLPVVMLSTEAADVMVDKAMSIGADAYVTKPVALDELDKAIQKALGAHGKIGSDEKEERVWQKEKQRLIQRTTAGAHVSDYFYRHIGHYSIDDGPVVGRQVVWQNISCRDVSLHGWHPRSG